ncbi:MAG: 50S ribosomal protein L20 [Planctomycetaceae bacterium]|nr:50S ribosomal protein L20 [Planctomycetaceae bacterium]
MRARKTTARRRARKRLMRDVKGNWGKRGKLVKMATETLVRARAFAFRDRRAKKRSFRALWITRLTAACRARGLRYSQFIHGLMLAKVGLNRKSLSELAIHSPELFDELVNIAKDHLPATVTATAAA